MPTLAQVLQGTGQSTDLGPRIVNVVSATPTTVETSYGNIVNACAGTPNPGQKVVVLTIDGAQYAVGWF